MRVPTYTSERGVSAPQIQTTQIKPLDLGGVVDAVEKQYAIAVKQEEEDFALFAETEAQRTGLAIDQKYAEIKDRIANGGSYAKAVQEFQAFYDKTTKKSLSQFGDDRRSDMVAQRIALDYERSGVEYSLRLKDAVRSRAKSDAASAAKARLDGYSEEFVNAQTPEEELAILTKASNTIASIGGGKDKVKKFTSNSIVLKSKLIGQDDPAKALDYIESNKKSLDIEDYITQRGAFVEKAEAFRVSSSVNSAIKDWEQGVDIVEPSKEDVDTYMAESSEQEVNGRITTEEFEQRIVGAISASGTVPTELKSRIETAFSVNPEKITPQMASDIARYSRIVDIATQRNASIVNGRKDGISEDDRNIANAISSKTRRGIDETTAVRETLLLFNDPDFAEAHKKAKSTIMRIGLTESHSPYTRFMEDAMDELDISEKGLSIIRSNLIDDYATNRALGMPHDDARDAAIKNQQGFIGKFNGVDVILPPHKSTTLRNEKKWKQAALEKVGQYRAFIKENGGYDPYLENTNEENIVLFGDESTQKMLSEGSNVLDIPFRIGYKNTNGDSIPITNPMTGQSAYVVASPEMVEDRGKKYVAEMKARNEQRRQVRFQESWASQPIENVTAAAKSVNFGLINESIDREEFAKFLIDRKIPMGQEGKFSTKGRFINSKYYNP